MRAQEQKVTKNRVLEVSLPEGDPGEYLVLAEGTERKRRGGHEDYDYDDPFIDEEETDSEAANIELRVENFFCLAGEHGPEKPPEKRSREKRARKKEDPADEEHQRKREKRETTRARTMEETARILGGMKEKDVLKGEKEIERVCIGEIVANTEIGKEGLVQRISESLGPEHPLQKAVENLVEKYVDHKYIEEKKAVLEKKSEGLKEKIRERIKEKMERNVREQAEEKSVEGVESAETQEEGGGEKAGDKVGEKDADGSGEAEMRFSFNEEFYELLLEYTENEYILYYLGLYLAGRKRVLEFTVKKSIFQKLQDLFPSGYRLNGSLGKKITSYRNRKKMKRSGFGQGEGTQAQEKVPGDSCERTEKKRGSPAAK
jgi:hypothetical protein